MIWASRRLQYLNQRMSQAQISRLTGIPASTISFAIREQRMLPPRHVRQLRNLYSRTVFRDLRDAGISYDIARAARQWSPLRVTNLLEQATSLVEKLAQYRLESYIEFLQAQNRYISDEHTLNILRESIRASLERSPVTDEHEVTRDSPSLRRIL